MTDDERVAPVEEATEEVVQTEVEETEAPEAAESTEGQEIDPPAEANAEEEKTEAQKRRARRKAAKARMQRETAEAQDARDKAQTKLAKIEAAATSSQPPKESDFADYNEYLLAVGAHTATQANANYSRETVSEEKQQADARLEALKAEKMREAAQTWAEQQAEASTRYTDFSKVVQSVPISSSTADLILSSDKGADVAYFLGSNPEIARNMFDMQPVEMAREFGLIEARITVPKPRTQSQAPDPVNTLKPKGGAVSDPAKMSVSEYRAWRAGGGTF
ncbi:MAG: hypothetical protein ABJ360_22515 [Roseobacter sp.]